MKPCIALFAGASFALGVVCGQEPVARPAHVAFLPGEPQPVLITWTGGAFDLRPMPRAGDPRPPSLGGGGVPGGDVAAVARLQPVNANTCLLVARRPLTSGCHLQLGLLRRVGGTWRLNAGAVLNDVVVEGQETDRGFVDSELVAWDEASRTATVVVQRGYALPPDRTGYEVTHGALYECEVVLKETTGATGFLAGTAPPARLVAVGTDVRTHRDGNACLVTTRVTDTERDAAATYPRSLYDLRLRAWLRDERGSWRDLDVPRLIVESDYGMLRRANGEVVVAMIAKSGDQDVLRTARWSVGSRGFVVDDEVLTMPRPKDHPAAWQLSGPTPKPWALVDGQPKRVQ